MAAGCLLAIYYPVLQQRAMWLRAPLVFCVCALAALGVRPLLLRFPFLKALSPTISALFIAAGVFGAVEGRYRILNNRLATWIGTLSYSLYLRQQPFAFSSFGHDVPWARLPLNLVCAVGAAVASYFCIEKPFLSYRSRG
jgi:peptidoglycan/LPS O-acetylase OafA/YrhL